jgi:hypothetical protein
MIVWFLIPTMIILSAVAVLVFTTSRQGTQDLVFEQSRDRTRLLASQLAMDLASYRSPLSSLSESTPFTSTSPLEVALDPQWPVGELGIFDLGVVILNREGIVVDTVHALSGMKGRYLPAVVELAESPAAGESDQLGFTAMRSNLVDGTNAVALSQPLYGRDGDVRGTAVGLFRIERHARARFTAISGSSTSVVGSHWTRTSEARSPVRRPRVSSMARDTSSSTPIRSSSVRMRPNTNRCSVPSKGRAAHAALGRSGPPTARKSSPDMRRCRRRLGR